MGGMLVALAPMLGAALAGGGLQKLLGGFQANGMDDKVQSWVGPGENAPLSAAEVESVVAPTDRAGRATPRRLARRKRRRCSPT